MSLRSRCWIVIVLASLGLALAGRPGLAATPEETKTYLDATKALREGNYQTAKTLLDELMKSSQDTDLLLKADEKLTEAINGLKKASLPKVPGVYTQKKSGTLLALNKEPIGGAKLMKEGAKTVMDALGAPSVNFLLNLSGIAVSANELTGFIVYNPDLVDTKNIGCVYLEEIKAGTRSWVDMPQDAQNKTVWVQYPEWSDVSKNGTKVSSDMLVKTKIGEGMFQISFPTGFTPPEPRNLAIVDGTNYAYPFVLQPSSVDMIYTQYINERVTTDDAVQAIKDALASTPDEPMLSDAMTVTRLRRGENDEAITSARSTIAMAEKAKDPQLEVFRAHLAKAEAAKITADVRATAMNDPAKRADAFKMLGTALQKDPKCYQAMSAMAELYEQENNLPKASEMAEGALKEARAASDWVDEYERRFRRIKSAQLRADLEANCQGDQSDLAACIDKAKDALRYDDDSPELNIIMARLYDKSGKPADAAKKAEKAAKVAEKRKLQTAPAYFQFTAAMCAKNGKANDATKHARKAVDLATSLGIDPTPYKTDLAQYEGAKK